MIDRSQRIPPLQSRTLLGAAAISFVICAVLPLMAAACLLGGGIAFAAIWLVVIAAAIVGYGGLIGGVLALFGNDEAKGFGCVSLIAGFLALALFNAIQEPWRLAATAAFEACKNMGTYIVLDIFIGKYVWILSWGVLALSLALAAALLVLIGLLRCEAALKYSLLRIGYTCPKCHLQRAPHFRCSNCKALIPDLGPTTYGILHAQCRNCETPLATTDMFGKLKLDKVCSRKECSADLNDPTLGHIGEFHIAIVGAASSGKTNLMVAAVWQLEHTFAPGNGLDVAFAEPTEEAAFRARVGQLERGEVLSKTAAVRTFNLTVTRISGQDCRLYLYDAAGEDFAEENRLSSHVFHHFVDGILFVVDPFAELDIRRSQSTRLDPAALKRMNPATQEASEILARLVNSLEATLGVRAGDPFPIPIALAVTKIDGLDIAKELGEGGEVSGAYMNMGAAARDASRQSARIRQFLQDSGLANFVSILESRFPRVGYFGASALGRLPDSSDRSPFQPRGVVAPLVWLCYQVRAFSDSLPIQVVASNALRILNRSLRGLQGTRAQVLAWLMIACAASLAFCGLWYAVMALIAAGASGKKS